MMKDGMKQWKPYELHTHTFHSDGKKPLEAMARRAAELELHGIVLTDHNTMSGLLDNRDVSVRTGIQIVNGLEWTTFFGHMLAIGLERYVDWRGLGPGDIHQAIDLVHEQDGAVGIAHPYRMGSPICTGCFWEYEIKDWTTIDFIEVWSGVFPSIQNGNLRAFRLWTSLLNLGFRITATSGRDWHDSLPDADPIAVSYIGLTAQQILQEPNRYLPDALHKGSVVVTMGPLLLFSLELEGEKYGPGDLLPVIPAKHKIKAAIWVDFESRKQQWQLSDQVLTVQLVSNLGIMQKMPLRASEQLSRELETDGLMWVRAELVGVFRNSQTMIAFTNPVYFTN